MNHDYHDIRERIDADPIWFDENAVPRYCDFGPTEVADIYAENCLLMLIECQGCGHEFKVAMSENSMALWMEARGLVGEDETIGEWVKKITLERKIREDTIHYGDPPNVGCCPAGPTMNSVPIRVLEFWRHGPKDKSYAWGDRVPELEVELNPEWAERNKDWEET